ncbi:ATP-dependent DNA helicase PIF1, partial [Brachionus plicatilis]
TPEETLINRHLSKTRYQRNLALQIQNTVDKELYLKEFDSSKNGPLHEQQWAKKEFQNYYNNMDKLNQFYCNNCHELWPTTLSYCKQCKDDSIKYSRENDMVPTLDDLPEDIKFQFENLTMIEEMLISPIIPVMSIIRLSSGALASRGFCANFNQNLNELITELPRLPKYLPILILKKKNQLNQSKNFIVNRKRVEICLKYLCEKNIHFISNGIKMNNDLCQTLPENDIITDLKEIHDKDDQEVTPWKQDSGPVLNENFSNFEEEEICDNEFIDIFDENESNEPLQDDIIKNTINFPTMSLNTVNEFTNIAMCSLIFPKLFPTGAADPTVKSRVKEITEGLGFKHLLKCVATNSKTKKFYYPFAQHPRFKFWAYDRLRRHRSLEQCKIFMKQNPNESNLSVKDLKDLLKTGESDTFMKKMSAYSSNITGSDSYWYKRRIELQSTFEQMKPASAFFTFSYPDNHWDDLHRLIPGAPAKSDQEKRRNVLSNPHLVDWFFSYKLDEFLKTVFDNVLDCEWRWHRYEWQSRSSIHAHGAVRFKNDPNLIDLTSKVYAGRLAFKKINESNYVQQNLESHQKLLDLIIQSNHAEKKVISYTDTLITAMNTKTDFTDKSVPVPHPCSLCTNRINDECLSKDYEELINCCQRHSCRLEGYCKSSLAKNH